jgi:hypothetical protein
MSNNIRLGAIGVQKVSTKLMEQGFLVSLPIYDDGYDLVTDWKGKLVRVQVKTTGGSDDCQRRKLKFFAIRGPGFGHMRKGYTPREIVTPLSFYIQLWTLCLLYQGKSFPAQNPFIWSQTANGGITGQRSSRDCLTHNYRQA